MDYFDLFYKWKSCYDIGMGIDIKVFLKSSKSSSNIIEYQMTLDEEETLLIRIKYEGNSKKEFIFEFLEYVTYDYFSCFYKKKDKNCEKYYIYTAADDQGTGIKIILEMY